jgi:hypothetical protein
MQSTSHAWADVFFHAITVLGSGLVAALVTWIGLRHQRKLRQAELQSHASFKARELIFDIRRKKYDQGYEQAAEGMKSLGELLIKAGYTPNDQKRDLVLPSLPFFQRTLLEIAISPAPVHAEGLQYMYQLAGQERAAFIKETLEINLETLPIEDYVAILWRYAEIFNELEGIRVGLLENTCHETFDDLLPNTIKSTQPLIIPDVQNQPLRNKP